MLEDIKRSYVMQADAVVPNWKKTNVNALCNLYVENEGDQIKRAGYFAAILLKKWGYIGRHFLNSKASGFTIEDCYDMILDAVLYTLDRRMWLNPESPIYKDPNGPDKILNRVIYSRRQLYYYNANCLKRCSNYGKSSLDQIQETVGDHCEVFSDETEADAPYDLDTRLLIKSFFDKGKSLEAVLLDNIMVDDCFSSHDYEVSYTTCEGEEKTTKREEHFFKLSKLLNNVTSFDSDYLHRVSAMYDVEEAEIQPALDIINNTDKNKLTRIIRSTLNMLSRDKKIKGFLCC